MSNRDNLNLEDQIKNRVERALNNKNVNKLSRSPMKYTVPTGQVSSVFLTLFGTVGSTIFGIAIFVLILLGSAMGNLFYTIAIGLSPLLIISLILNIKGSHIRRRLRRFQQYTICLGKRNYCFIKELSSATGLSSKYIEKDLRKMIVKGMFPEGHIDNQKTIFILTNECYHQYLEVQSLEIKEEAEKKRLEKQNLENQHLNKISNKNHQLSSEIEMSLNEGRRFVSDIKRANFAIPGEGISLKLDRLEEITGKIYDYVEIHPERFVEIKKFTGYFLPETLKLVEAYRRLDNQTVQGVNILSAKQEIEEMMDTINLAFENLLDDLFQDIAMDISTDISVLETMLAQEGLTGHSMRTKNKKKEDKA